MLRLFHQKILFIWKTLVLCARGWVVKERFALAHRATNTLSIITFYKTWFYLGPGLQFLRFLYIRQFTEKYYFLLLLLEWKLNFTKDKIVLLNYCDTCITSFIHLNKNCMENTYRTLYEHTDKLNEWRKCINRQKWIFQLHVPFRTQNTITRIWFSMCKINLTAECHEVISKVSRYS